MKDQVVDALIKEGVVKFGDFILKSGERSPVYIDLRLLISFPELFQQVAELYLDKIRRLSFDRLAGIPYGGLPIVTAVGLLGGYPFIYPRKEKKSHGTAKLIEGVFRKGEKILLIDDLITTGMSTMEAFRLFERQGLIVEDVVVLIDRQQGGRDLLKKHNLRLHNVFDLTFIVERGYSRGFFSKDLRDKVINYLRNSR